MMFYQGEEFILYACKCFIFVFDQMPITFGFDLLYSLFYFS